MKKGVILEDPVVENMLVGNRPKKFISKMKLMRKLNELGILNNHNMEKLSLLTFSLAS